MRMKKIDLQYILSTDVCTIMESWLLVFSSHSVHTVWRADSSTQGHLVGVRPACDRSMGETAAGRLAHCPPVLPTAPCHKQVTPSPGDILGVTAVFKNHFYQQEKQVKGQNAASGRGETRRGKVCSDNFHTRLPTV